VTFRCKASCTLPRAGGGSTRPLPADLRAAAEDANPYTRLGAIAGLRSRLLSENLSAAAGARDALVTMAASDTQLVAGAAKSALAELVLHVTPASLDFQDVTPPTSTSPQRVHLSGPPLARHDRPGIGTLDARGGCRRRLRAVLHAAVARRNCRKLDVQWRRRGRNAER
jgi:hypothetical protein